MIRVHFYILMCLLFLSCGKNSSTVVNKNEPFLNSPISTESTFLFTKNTVHITKGSYAPLYGKIKKLVTVNDFDISVYPVTNQQFLDFVKANPNWRKSNIKKIFADDNYLKTWQNDTTLGSENLPNSPVTNVSWFAANAFCKSIDARLPTIDEWEYVAMANKKLKDARKLKNYNQYILNWYEKQDTYKNEIGSTYKNIWGVYDLHGLVWEWTDDFNSILLDGENRNSTEIDKNLFCGSAALGTNDLMNYAAFMRYAFRGSLKANYNIQNLGFRYIKK